MKIRIKNLGLLIAVMFAAINFMSCGHEDDEPANPETHNSALIGKWRRTQSGLDWTHIADITFKSSGKYSLVGTYIDYEDGKADKEVSQLNGMRETNGGYLTMICTSASDSDE